VKTNPDNVILKMDESALSELLALLGRLDISIVKEPQAGLVMMSARDPFDTDFYVGEVLVTEAEVEYMGRKGYAMVMGDDPDRALARASLDALEQAGYVGKEIKRHLERQTRKVSSVERKEEALVRSTRVSFETMRLG
jgi:alpha-D-ribose 1-methylphosphonate 5-triphosphate synthase subunit PhnG